MAATIVLDFAYGYEVKPNGDERVLLPENVTKALSKAFAPGAFLADTFKWCKYFCLNYACLYLFSYSV